VKADGIEIGIDERTVGTIDIAPTILDLLGVAELDAAAGRSLRPSDPGVADPAAFSATERDGEYRAIVAGRYKLIHDLVRNGEALYDLEADPQERENLRIVDPTRFAELRGILRRWNKQVQADSPPEVTLAPGEDRPDG
jgi:arylsulfatase A-like enzyme